MSGNDWQDTTKKISMGERVGKQESGTFLRNTACVHVAEREIMGYMEFYKIMFPEDKEFIEFLEQVGVGIKRVGESHWYRDVITDLALKLGDKAPDDSRVTDTSNVLEME